MNLNHKQKFLDKYWKKKSGTRKLLSKHDNLELATQRLYFIYYAGIYLSGIESFILVKGKYPF